MTTITRRQLLLSANAFMLLSLHPSQATSSPFKTPYALAGTIITGEENRVLNDHALIVNEKIIEALIPASRLPEQIPILSENGWILPGIINCHVHRTYTPHERTERFLSNGVTSIGDVGSPLSKLSLLNSSPFPTATPFFTGPILCAKGGYPIPVHGKEYAMEVSSPVEGREAVRQLADLGASMIKISFEPGPYAKAWPMLTPETAHAICDQARKLGMTVRCHVENYTGLHLALDAGVHTIEHTPHHWIENGASHPTVEQVNGALRPVESFRKQLKRMVREDVILTPTLEVLSKSPFNGPELYEPVRYFNNMGGRIALGNDYPYRRTDPGMPLREMELMTKAGMTPTTIIHSGTAVCAEVCGQKNIGTLQPGMQADIIVAKNNPLQDIRALGYLKWVIKKGLPLPSN